jgi:hypothetical protein
VDVAHGEHDWSRIFACFFCGCDWRVGDYQQWDVTVFGCLSHPREVDVGMLGDFATEHQNVNVSAGCLEIGGFGDCF